MMPCLQAPIVLVHGLFGFDRLQIAGYTIANYFPGIVDALEAAGNRVLVPALSPTASVAERAAQLKAHIQGLNGGAPVHLVAHSMGGLDARYMISHLGMADQVLSLTSLGTPHRGTVFADWAVRRLERMVKPAFHFLGLPVQAFYDLTTTACRQFNQTTPDSPKVRYFSIAGQHDGGYRNPSWMLSYRIVMEAEGPNDGVVSHQSARHGEADDIWDGDHFALVNWGVPFGRRAARAAVLSRYQRLIQRLADLGF